MDAMSRIWSFLLICLACLVHHLRADLQNYCTRPLNTGDCGRQPSDVYTYDKRTNRCVRAEWRGCPSTNKFDTQAMCTRTCTVPGLFKFQTLQFNEEGKNLVWNNTKWNNTDYIYDFKQVENPDPKKNTYVRFYPEPLKWFHAWTKCIEDGAYLGVPRSKQMLENIVFMIKRYVPCGIIHTGCHSSYTDMHDFNCMDTFMHDYNAFLRWRQRNDSCRGNASQAPCKWPTLRTGVTGLNEQLEKMKHDVVLLRSDGTVDVGKNIDKFPFFCTKLTDKDKPLILNKCNRDDYEYMGGYCYKFHTQKKTWEVASKICNSEDAYLAVTEPESAVKFENETVKTEANYLFNIYLRSNHFTRRTTKYLIQDNDETAFIGHINFSKKPNTVQWHSIFGYDFEGGIIDYCKNATDHCGTILGNYTGDDPNIQNYSATTGCKPCNTEHYFICKKKSNQFGVEKTKKD